MNSGKLIARTLVRNMTPVRTYKAPSAYRPPTLNDLPVPQGDFFMQHAARERKYNAYLAAGVLIFATTLFVVKESKIINFNWSPPDTYE
ncbi:CLUMA_CG011899, isoform A [Clunio marinus]|uniref:CLUMA_CG011899, isoform A n=1 Tax=Clunio marinus TaxID=568069 RepID=A0A1J1IG81_9DIPT|nr:CLUMA_CG011899, isoform A [Clunio marinus]